MKKLAIVTTHPIQYNAPWFLLLAKRRKCVVKVFYTWGQLENGPKYDPGFDRNIAWDIPLLEGYEYCFVKNTSRKAGSHHFKGIDNPTLVKDVQDWYPDAILVFGWNFKSHLQLLRHYRNKVKILFRGDSVLLDEPNGFSMRKLMRRVFLKWVYRNIDVALYTGSANREYFRKHGLKEDQLVFAPHAIDNERFAKAANNIRVQMGIANDEVIFLFAGKLETKKNPGLLLDAFINAGMENAHLVIAGNGDLETSLKSKVQKQNPAMKERIHFMDFQNQSKMPEVYHGCDVLVLPSRGPGETWGLAVNEAMASGKAVLVSDKCGCCCDLVKENINGSTFNSNNLEDLLKKIKMLAADKNKLSAMGTASARIINAWSYTKICEAIEGIIK